LTEKARLVTSYLAFVLRGVRLGAIHRVAIGKEPVNRILPAARPTAFWSSPASVRVGLTGVTMNNRVLRLR